MIVAGGTWVYWRKAVAVAGKRANVVAIAMALSGVITLALNVAGQ